MAKTKRPSSISAPSNEVQKIESSAPVAPKILYRDQMQVDHHLFKGLVAKAKRSDKWGPIKIKEIEHVHFFHSVSSNGTVQEFSNSVCGHVHRWSWEVDAQGNLVAKCGPALKKVVRPGQGGVSKVSYEAIKVRDADTGDLYTDNHSHPMQYLGSDPISKAKVQQIQKSNSETIGSPAGVRINSEPPQVEGYSMGDTDRETAQE